MLNQPSFYSDLGAKVAEARNQRDEARAAFHFDHFRRALALESDDDKSHCSTLYREAYEENRVKPRVDYFK